MALGFFFHLLVTDIMDLDGGGCRNMTESPYFLAIQEWNSLKVLTLLFLPFSQCAFCIVPLPLLVLRLHTAHNGLFSALPLSFTNFHCCESDLELKKWFYIDRSALPFLCASRTDWALPRGRGAEEPVAGPDLRKREGQGLPSPSPGRGGGGGQAGPGGAAQRRELPRPPWHVVGVTGGARPHCHWSSPRKGRDYRRGAARGLVCGREGGGVPIGPAARKRAGR